MISNPFQDEPYIPTVKDIMHDFPVKKYPEGKVGEYFCRCIYCHRDFIGHKYDYECETCVDGLTP
jgi:hypothetical protein